MFQRTVLILLLSLFHLSPSLAAIKVVAGGHHTCALTTIGGVQCWGYNGHGQLGDNTTTFRATPVDVIGLNRGISALAAGESHTCALSELGGVKCWGYNEAGQLGDQSTATRLTPVDVIGLGSGVAAITAGARHTCALTELGGAKCWGVNDKGQLGDGTTTNNSMPVDVVGLDSGVTALAAARHHTCALTDTGGVKCWGYNSSGRLGDNTTEDKLTPVDVVDLDSGVSAIMAGGNHTCARLETGGVKCWGYNGYGQLGDGTAASRPTPVEVIGLSSGVVALTAGEYHTCARTDTGGLKCWGHNGHGQLGDNTTTTRVVPINVAGLDSGVSDISAGNYHTCALTDNGAIKCWGVNYYGQLGDNTTIWSSTPLDVVGLDRGLSSLALGHDHTCALTDAGGVKCWGYNNYAQLGDSPVPSSSTPLEVPDLDSGVSTLTAGYYHTCALTDTGGVRCWGYNDRGQLGDGTKSLRRMPVNVEGLDSGIVALATGSHHTCALLETGSVKCWGRNDHGQLGDNTTDEKLTPVDVIGLDSGISTITANGSHTCALLETGGVKCWGYNHQGQLGNDTTTSSSTPVDVIGLDSGVSALTAGVYHTCALLETGSVKCWGHNAHGQLGDGTMTGRRTPVEVSGLSSSVLALTAGVHHTCALLETGSVKCWGHNNYGQLGDGTTIMRRMPKNVVGLASGVSKLVAGIYHTCAVTETGGIKCWGRNLHGELGDGRLLQRESPPAHVVGCDELAIYFNKTRELYLPCVAAPLQTDISGLAIEEAGAGLYSAWLQIPFGFSDFELQAISFIGVLTGTSGEHAQFEPESGRLDIPKVMVPTVMVYGGLTPADGPTVYCHAQLQRSVLREEVFSLTEYECRLEN